MDQLVLAVKTSDGSYQALNEAVFIKNPEILAQDTSKIFKAASKKGIQGLLDAGSGQKITDARYANSKQTLFNLDLADVISSKSAKGSVSYNYKGKTYYFSDCAGLKDSIRDLNLGYEPYMYGKKGRTPVAVSLCVLLSYDDSTKNLIDPAARTKGKKFYTLNVYEKSSRETLEAVFLYLGEIFGDEDCYVTNWILGNEINASAAWNYSGNLSFDQYVKRYTTAFQILYNAVKAQKTGNTISISLDNGWTAVTDTYAGKKTLDSFAQQIHQKNPNIQWSIAYHPYSYPLTRVDFWNDTKNTTNDTSTQYISMKNINVLSNYAASMEKKYGMKSGSIRLLLTEQGFSYDSKDPKQQAQAIARGYYTAEFNDRIDAFIIRSLVDSSVETKGGLYLGIMNQQTEKRTSFYVYEYMDSDLSKMEKLNAKDVVSQVNCEKFNDAKNILCKTNWKSIIPGFNASKLSAM